MHNSNLCIPDWGLKIGKYEVRNRASVEANLKFAVDSKAECISANINLVGHAEKKHANPHHGLVDESPKIAIHTSSRG